MTVAEYAEWGMQPGSPDSRDELIDGEIVPLLAHHRMHGLANALIGGCLYQYFENHGPGYATLGSGVVVAPDSVLSVDVAVYPWAYKESRGPGGWAVEVGSVRRRGDGGVRRDEARGRGVGGGEVGDDGRDAAGGNTALAGDDEVVALTRPELAERRPLSAVEHSCRRYGDEQTGGCAGLGVVREPAHHVGQQMGGVEGVQRHLAGAEGHDHQVRHGVVDGRQVEHRRVGLGRPGGPRGHEARGSRLCRRDDQRHRRGSGGRHSFASGDGERHRAVGGR